MEVVELDRGADHLEQARQQADADPHRLQGPYEVQHLARVDAAGGDDRAVHVERLGEVPDLAQTGFGEAVRGPGCDLVEVEVGDDVGADPAVAGQAGADRLGGELIADEQAALDRSHLERELTGAGAQHDQ